MHARDNEIVINGRKNEQKDITEEENSKRKKKETSLPIFLFDRFAPHTLISLHTIQLNLAA